LYGEDAKSQMISRRADELGEGRRKEKKKKRKREGGKTANL
jgi:hypothetical protein